MQATLEYKTEGLSFGTDKSTEELNARAAEGWDLVTAFPFTAQKLAGTAPEALLYCVFKRAAKAAEGENQVFHFAAPGGVLCGSQKPGQRVVTTDPTRVTCPECLAKMKAAPPQNAKPPEPAEPVTGPPNRHRPPLKGGLGTAAAKREH